MSNLVSRIESATARGGRIVFVGSGEPREVSWAELHAEARAMAAGLQARGVGPGHHVAILGPTTRRLVTAIQATWLSGAAAVVLPLPMRMSSIDEFVSQTCARIINADAVAVLVDADLAPFVEPQPGDPPMVILDELPMDAAGFNPPAIDPDTLAIIQFTSGSTADPKGVMLPHRTVVANLDGIYRATAFDPDDEVLVSWLPLYHDMGLVGMLTLPMTTGCDLVLASPQDFMASPARWMEWLSCYGGTATAGPNFSWILATRALRRLVGLDLSRLRIALNGAEPVDTDTVEALVTAGAPHGLRPGAVFPAFGMAEVAIAGTFPEPMTGLRIDAVDARVLETEQYAAPVEDPFAPGVRRLARLGRPIPGLEALVVVAEAKVDDTAPVRSRVADKVRDAVGLPARDVVLVAAGSLPKTSSGKLQRSLCRARYLGRELQTV